MTNIFILFLKVQHMIAFNVMSYTMSYGPGCENTDFDASEKERRRPACTSAQSYQHLFFTPCKVHVYYLI